MTNEQYELAKKFYESKNPGCKFENLRLYAMNIWLSKAISNNKKKEGNK